MCAWLDHEHAIAHTIAGANVILTTKGIDDMSLKYFVEAGAIACRRVPKDDLRQALGMWPRREGACLRVGQHVCTIPTAFMLRLAAGAWPRPRVQASLPRWRTWRGTRRLTPLCWAGTCCWEARRGVACRSPHPLAPSVCAAVRMRW